MTEEKFAFTMRLNAGMQAEYTRRHDAIWPALSQALTEAGVAFSYLEYGSYFSQWKERLAIKMWSGWPTFPQVFVHGTLVGGFTDLQAAIADDSLKVLLEANQD